MVSGPEFARKQYLTSTWRRISYTKEKNFAGKQVSPGDKAPGILKRSNVAVTATNAHTEIKRCKKRYDTKVLSFPGDNMADNLRPGSSRKIFPSKPPKR